MLIWCRQEYFSMEIDIEFYFYALWKPNFSLKFEFSILLYLRNIIEIDISLSES